MAILSKHALLEKLKARIPETPTDDDISFLEDVADTFASWEGNSSENWQQKFEENDAAWRKRYTERFFGGAEDDTAPPNPALEPDGEPEPAPDKNIEQLFE